MLRLRAASLMRDAVLSQACRCRTHSAHRTRVAAMVHAVKCRRAGKLRAEGMAHYNMGVLYDNHALYSKSIAV